MDIVSSLDIPDTYFLLFVLNFEKSSKVKRQEIPSKQRLNMTYPLVSVIIPTYRRAEFLCATIDSVLNQTYPNIEIIVVDDNGIGTEYQKNTEKRLLPYIEQGKIKYLCHEVNKNGSAARNTGFRASHGEYVNFLDDDDELMPKKIELQVNCLLGTDKVVGATYCNSKNIRIKSIINKKIHFVTKYTEEGNILEDYLLAKCPFGTSSLLFKREILIALNGFDESYLRHQDVELMTRFFINGYNVLCSSKKPLLVYDLSKDRGNVTSPKKDYEIKNKYIRQFSPDFERISIMDKVAFHFWFSCAANALYYKDYTVFVNAINKAEKYGKIKSKNYILLIKRFFIGLLFKFR